MAFPKRYQSVYTGRAKWQQCLCLYSFELCITIQRLYFANIEDNYLNTEWQEVLKEAIRLGNSIHDQLFDRQGVNVSPENSIAAVGELCQVGGMAQEFDVFEYSHTSAREHCAFNTSK